MFANKSHKSVIQLYRALIEMSTPEKWGILKRQNVYNFLCHASL